MGTKAPQESDAVLIDRCAAGQEEAFRELFDRYREHVYRVARRLVRDREEALDLTQEAFIKAFRSLDRFRGQSSFKTYLTRIAVNACLDFRRRLRRATETGSAGAMELDEERVGVGGSREAARANVVDPLLQAEKRELQRALEEALDRLPENLRTTLLLHAVEGFTYREVADALEIPVGTVMSRIFYARNHLRKDLEPFLRE